MADYYSILKKTLSGLPRNTVDNRNVVYGKARQAIDRQLRALDPTPPEEAIARQMKLLEQAIATVEAEFSGGPAPAAPAQGGAVPTARPTAPAPRAPAPRAPEARQAPAVTPRPQAPAPQSPRPAQQAPARPAPQAPAAQQRPAAAPQGAPRAGPKGGAVTPAYDAMLDELGDYDRTPQGRQRVSALGKERRRGGWFVNLLVTLLVLAILAAGGYALWRNKEPLLTALGLEDMMPGMAADTPASADGSQPAGNTESAGTDANDGKEDVRLNPNGDTVNGQPDEDNTAKPVREAGRLPTANEPASSEPVPPPQSPATEQQPVQVNPVGQDGTAQQQAGTPEGAQPDTANGQEGLPPPAIAQKAYLYEEGGAGAGATRDNAAIVWSLEEQPPADGMPAEAVIRGQFDVPGRGLVMQLTIRRNTDEALPASHIIELRFETPADFSGGEIDNVARFVMKSSEQARGEGLIAVPAKIDTGYFLIALNNLAQAQETNRKLLTESSWIDIPIGYTSGRRALVTLEKGAIGEKVFKDAFADWDTR